ncbi:hypothetical protein NWE60_00360 [Mycoplasmopsis felis]|nr:hypothetical protein [Mycoplasmopsis felis]WAM01141.1 hypothetical protein NWE60_00360 [Mycoplasmopsis felis]
MHLLYRSAISSIPAKANIKIKTFTKIKLTETCFFICFETKSKYPAPEFFIINPIKINNPNAIKPHLTTEVIKTTLVFSFKPLVEINIKLPKKTMDIILIDQIIISKLCVVLGMVPIQMR